LILSKYWHCTSYGVERAWMRVFFTTFSEDHEVQSWSNDHSYLAQKGGVGR
jgi:hypothetical protein